jgi:glycine cleavage system aminomethyltransferase T
MTKLNTPISVSPLQAWHTARGARFADVDGWRVPMAYSSIAEETAAARTEIALADISPLAKLMVRGNGLVTALAGQAPQGTVIRLEASEPAWICRLSGDQCLLLSASSRNMFQARLENLPAYKPERIFDVTSSYAGFALFGPEHAGVLRRLTSFDVERIALPGSCAETGLAGVHTILVRPPGFLLAILIYVAWEMGGYVCERIVEAAGSKAIVPLGMEALKTLWSL